jgi:hypothetical protein
VPHSKVDIGLQFAAGLENKSDGLSDFWKMH